MPLLFNGLSENNAGSEWNQTDFFDKVEHRYGVGAWRFCPLWGFAYSSVATIRNPDGKQRCVHCGNKVLYCKNKMRILFLQYRTLSYFFTTYRKPKTYGDFILRRIFVRSWDNSHWVYTRTSQNRQVAIRSISIFCFMVVCSWKKLSSWILPG